MTMLKKTEHVISFCPKGANLFSVGSELLVRSLRTMVSLLIAVISLGASAQTDTLRLTLDECISMARRQSVDAAVALGELKSAYWQWRSYKANLLPEVSFSSSGSYNKRYTSYQQADGGVSYVRNDYLGLNGSLYVTQKIWPTGGTLSVESSLDYLHQSATSSCRSPLPSHSRNRSSA